MTAVEWLTQQLTEVDYNCINKTFLQSDKSLAGYKMRELFEQAKEMFEQQIIDAFESGVYDGGENVSQYNMNSEQYYNETFKNK